MKRKMAEDQDGRKGGAVSPKKRSSSSKPETPRAKHKRTQALKPSKTSTPSLAKKGVNFRKGAQVTLKSKGKLSKKITSSKGRGKKPAATTPAKKKVPTKTRTVASKILKSKKDRSSEKRKAAAKAKTKPALKDKGGKKKEVKALKGRAKLDPNRKLVPNTKIELVKKDPMFEVKNEKSMPEVSKVVQCKRAIRAVLTNDLPLLRRLLKDTKGIPTVFFNRSVAVQENALGYAIKTNNQPCIQAMLAELNNRPSRCKMPTYSLRKENTGSYNYRSLGHAVRAINVSRGGREGLDAFLKDDYEDDSLLIIHEDFGTVAEKLANPAASFSTVEFVCRESKHIKTSVMVNIPLFVRSGNRNVAGRLLKQNYAGWGYNNLHVEALLCDKPEELSPFKAASVRKKPHSGSKLMPIHCAAINPNPKILEKLLDTVHDINLADQRGKKIIHYAAACKGSGPLELLLNRSAFADEKDKGGLTPLMIAASLNRTRNIEVLMKKLKSGVPDKTGGVHQKGPNGQTPLHYAAENGHNDSVQALLKHGAILKSPLSAVKNKLTPFMVACEQGHLETVKVMADLGAKLDHRDKLKRTPLMLATMNGHVPIVAFLLRKGCDPNASDSSGNTPLHYAAAYGWWFVLRLLLSGGADPNALNDWKVPPLAVAFMKGHVGCADLLLEEPNVDVNFRDEDGWTIVMLTVGQLTIDMFEQLKHLVTEKNADVTLKDANDWTALHHLAATTFCAKSFGYYQDDSDKINERKKISVDMATLLISNGCDPNAKTSDGQTALDIAIKRDIVNAEIVKFLLWKGSKLTNFTNDRDENLLHLMAKRSFESDQTDLLNIVVDNMKNETDMETPGDQTNSFIRQLTQGRDLNKLTPLLAWTAFYSTNTKNNKMTEGFERARAFFKRLLEITDSDVNARSENKFYQYAGKGVLHLLCEMTEIAAGGTDYPALDLFLAFKPDINIRDEATNTPLILAARSGRVLLVEKLVGAGADVNLKSKDETPLLIAIRKDMFETVDILATAYTVNAAHELNKLTPLHHVAMSHRNTPNLTVCEVMNKLLDKGARIQARDAKGRTPLHYACRTYIEDRDPSLDALKLLINNKADVFAEDKEGRLPLHYLFFNMDNVHENSAIDPIGAVSLLKDTMRKKKIAQPDELGQTPIHAAAYRGAIISLMDMVDYVSSIDMKDSVGNTPLSMACMGEHVSVVIFLMQQGASISATVTPLEPIKNEEEERARKKREEEEEKKMEHFWVWQPLNEKKEKTSMPTIAETLFRRVVKNQWQGILFLLMDKLKKFQVPYITPIKAAIEEHRFQMALNLISNSRNHPVDGLADKDQNLLHILALQPCYKQSNKVAEELLSKGVSLTYDQFNCTPLTYAVLTENFELAKLLWDHMNPQDGKRALKTTDAKGRPVMAAAFWRRQTFNTDLVGWLVEIGASLNVAFPVPLWKLEGKGPENVPDNKIEEWFHHCGDHPVGHLTPLLAAIRVGDPEQVKHLLDKGADPNVPGEDMLTPAMYAVKKNNMTLVKLLLENGNTKGKISGSKKKKTKSAKKKATKSAVKSIGSFGVKQWKSGGTSNADYSRDDSDMEVDNEENKDMDHDQTKNVKAEAAMEKPSRPVDLSAQDSRGRTVTHHMMRTCEYGTYENEDMLKLLRKFKAPLDTKDNDGKTPLDYGLQGGSDIMVEQLQKMLYVRGDNKQSPNYKSTWTDGCDWTGEPSIDYKKDAKALLTKLEEENNKDLEELPKYPPPKVDKDAQLREAGEVLMDTDQDIPYDILMTMVDVSYGRYGLNVFYKMQLVYAKGKDMYILLTRWGRVGDRGQFQRTPFGTKEDAVTEFCKIFKAKSGNVWSNIKEFTKVPEKYNLVRTDPYFDRRPIKSVEFNLKSDKPSKLPSGTQELLQTLISPNMLKHAMEHCRASEKYLPFGHLQRDVLEQAASILREIMVLTEKSVTDLPREQQNETYEKMATLSSEFYMLIPDDSFTHQSMRPINDTNKVSDLMKRLADMADLEITGNLMLGAQHRVTNVNPLDYIYRNLDCEIEPLSEDDVMSQLILQQIHQTKAHHNLNVQRIYRLRRKGEEDTFASCNVDNHRLLWHGTKAFNVLSILKRGMMIRPIGVKVSGARYGLALYHSDIIAKSLDYCDRNDPGCGSRFLFINEVALGVNKTVEENLDYYDSITYRGRKELDPTHDLFLPAGAVFPMGKPIASSGRYSDNEYVVFNDNQVCLRYLVQVKA